MTLGKSFLPIAIVLASLIIGGSFYAIQINKQQSIERQQQLDLQEKHRAEEAKSEQDNKEFVAQRKSDCLDIYKTESDKWNNVRGWRYDEEGDKCMIRYKDDKPKSDTQCDENYPTNINGSFGLTILMRNSLCKEGEFENSF
ncbi:MAG: hypothetical protein HY420_05025 [Candidatus Kerfeldbacteria bacterium]|nr:hypothetical protein [Candidatus Kerfeldbacteria bacterium]